MTPFHGVDYYNLETLLSEEEILVRNTVREFVDDNVGVALLMVND